VVERGLSEELDDRHYLIVDGVDGRSHYVDIGKGEAVEPIPPGAVVRIEPKSTEARAVDRAGRVHVLANADFVYAYRHSEAPADLIFTEALYQAEPGDQETIRAEMQKITESREATQPVKSRTGGSTFKNPPGAKSWQLIDEAGCRGLTIGGAQVSELHCNFLINTGGATAADLERLGETVRARVLETSGVRLEWEIKRLGAWPDGMTIPEFTPFTEH